MLILFFCQILIFLSNTYILFEMEIGPVLTARRDDLGSRRTSPAPVIRFLRPLFDYFLYRRG